MVYGMVRSQHVNKDLNTSLSGWPRTLPILLISSKKKKQLDLGTSAKVRKGSREIQSGIPMETTWYSARGKRLCVRWSGPFVLSQGGSRLRKWSYPLSRKASYSPSLSVPTKGKGGKLRIISRREMATAVA
jgi:hypothetical protein